MRSYAFMVLVAGGALLAACQDAMTRSAEIGTPAEITPTLTGSTAKVAWSAVPGADGYNVRLSSNGEVLRATDVPAGVTTAIFENLRPNVYDVSVSARRAGAVGGAGTRRFGSSGHNFGGSTVTREALVAKISAEFPASLHGTAKGMKYWYEAAAGFGARIGVPYSALTCGSCHAYNPALTGAPANQPCLACHTMMPDQPGVVDYDSVDNTRCLKCHSRQAAEIAMALPDVHRAAGMVCSDCHTAAELHSGAGVTSTFDVLKPRCEDCHAKGAYSSSTRVPATDGHWRHGTKLSCQSCHMTGSLTCVNCHLEDDINKQQRVAFARYADWTFLGNWRGQVHPVNVQTVEYMGQTFAAWGPYNGHTVTADGRVCTSCHASANVVASSLQVTHWNSETKKMEHITGVIPVPWDYARRLSFDFVAKGADGTWNFLKTGADASQMLFATPLSREQMQKLVTAR